MDHRLPERRLLPAGRSGARVDDLRFAFCILTTFWYREAKDRRLHATDLRHFHRAFGAARLHKDDSARGTLNREQLLSGAETLLGSWFGAAYADDARRGWGIAFPTDEERAGY